MDPSFPINFSAPPLTTGLITSPAPQAPPLSALSALSAASASASAFTSAAPHPQLSHPYPHALHSQSQSQNQNPLPLLHQQQPFQQQAPRYHENRLLGLDDASEHFDGSSDHPRKKQKRNKPTLSCEDCVERKTKVSMHYLVHVDLQGTERSNQNGLDGADHCPRRAQANPASRLATYSSKVPKNALHYVVVKKSCQRKKLSVPNTDSRTNSVIVADQIV